MIEVVRSRNCVAVEPRRLLTALCEERGWLRGGALRSPSYYAGTAGHVRAETIRRYIERTEHISGTR